MAVLDPEEVTRRFANTELDPEVVKRKFAEFERARKASLLRGEDEDDDLTAEVEAAAASAYGGATLNPLASMASEFGWDTPGADRRGK